MQSTTKVLITVRRTEVLPFRDGTLADASGALLRRGAAAAVSVSASAGAGSRQQRQQEQTSRPKFGQSCTGALVLRSPVNGEPRGHRSTGVLPTWPSGSG